MHNTGKQPQPPPVLSVSPAGGGLFCSSPVQPGSTGGEAVGRRWKGWGKNPPESHQNASRRLPLTLGGVFWEPVEPSSALGEGGKLCSSPGPSFVSLYSSLSV